MRFEVMPDSRGTSPSRRPALLRIRRGGVFVGMGHNPFLIGVVEKPLVGRMAFTPLTRGARGVGFQPREGKRDG